eukprot:TRINITY_DN10043_c0_g1_i2.p1 TRINITY_DN10043_c0_g1~~TRINITY_DN10043_c0_g1_i2.p1  ORF type:complete len:335 (+),score=84.08 TRINITY_DN10043_c0_g1_i2:303-1307(+)
MTTGSGSSTSTTIHSNGSNNSNDGNNNTTTNENMAASSQTSGSSSNRSTTNSNDGNNSNDKSNNSNNSNNGNNNISTSNIAAGDNDELMENCRKRWRMSDEEVLPVNDEKLEARATKDRGNGIFALCELPKGWCWLDHPVCVASSNGKRRLPDPGNIDELMQELSEGAAGGNEPFKRMLRGKWRLAYVQRFFDIQDTTDEELPVWAKNLKMSAVEYNTLVAQLQSNVARHTSEGMDGIVLNPYITIANHECDANMELSWAPHEVNKCSCGLGHYVLCARRDIAAGEELCFSYLGTGVLTSQEDFYKRQAVLEKRWGFKCCCSLCEQQQKQLQQR